MDNYPRIYLYKRIVQAKLFIDNNFCNSIDLTDIADEACVSMFHFLRLFKMVYGKTPHQYLTCKRIEHSRHLLQQGNGVSDACYQCGFESLGSFSVLFKKVTGQTPAAYRQAQQQLKLEMDAQPLVYIPGCFARALAPVNT